MYADSYNIGSIQFLITGGNYFTSKCQITHDLQQIRDQGIFSQVSGFRPE